MSWPTSFNLATLNVGKAGSLPSLIAFGSEGIWSGVIVKNIRSTPIISEVPVENGSGLTVTSVVINDGDMVEITVDDDRAVTWPLTGATLTVVNPQPNGTYGTPELFQVYNNNYNVAAKAVGERVITAKKYSLITPVQM